MAHVPDSATHSAPKTLVWLRALVHKQTHADHLARATSIYDRLRRRAAMPVRRSAGLCGFPKLPRLPPSRRSGSDGSCARPKSETSWFDSKGRHHPWSSGEPTSIGEYGGRSIVVMRRAVVPVMRVRFSPVAPSERGGLVNARASGQVLGDWFVASTPTARTKWRDASPWWP